MTNDELQRLEHRIARLERWVMIVSEMQDEHEKRLAAVEERLKIRGYNE